MNKKQLWVMCGIPGSGKDYWIEKHKNSFNGSVKIVSRDIIRFSKLHDGEDYFAHEKEVFKDYISEINDGIDYYDITIANATHLNAASRGKLLRQLNKNKNLEINAMVIDTPLNICLQHNSTRKGLAVVPENQIKNMSSNFEIPELEEGFNNIYIYSIKDNKPFYRIRKEKDNE